MLELDDEWKIFNFSVIKEKFLVLAATLVRRTERFQHAGSRVRSASDVSQARLGAGAFVQLPCTGHPHIRHRTCWLRNWHTRWRVVWSCPGSTTVMLCYTALQATASSSYSVWGTTHIVFQAPYNPTPARCWGRYTPAASSTEDSVLSGSADVQSSQNVHAGVRLSPNPGSTTRP